MRTVLPEGTLDEFNEWLDGQIRVALETAPEVVVVYPDGATDTLRLNDDGELETVPGDEPTPEMEPIVEPTDDDESGDNEGGE